MSKITASDIKYWKETRRPDVWLPPEELLRLSAALPTIESTKNGEQTRRRKKKWVPWMMMNQVFIIPPRSNRITIVYDDEDHKLDLKSPQVTTDYNKTYSPI